jgi:protein-disulfide isomerase
MNMNKWVDDRLTALDDGSEWQPGVTGARARLHAMDRQARVRRRWAWVGAVAAGLGLMAFMQPRACANPRGCFQSGAQKGVPRAEAPVPAAAPVGKPQVTTPATETSTVRNYKESGSAEAPLTVEVYSDYECPSCAAFYRDVMPLLVTGYVQTGKVRLLHRDFPLPQHPYAKLAARYANAAGEAGQYDQAVQRLFETQTIWGATGNIEEQLAPVLPAPVLRKVRDMVEHDQRLDDTVAADQVRGAGDRVQGTPTLVVVWKGNRQAISSIPSYTLLKSYLDALLAR